MSLKSRQLEVWAGIECTVNRVEDRYFNQCEQNGHFTREGDLERFSALGIRTLRYPILWESVAAHSPNIFNWKEADKNLTRIKELGMEPIVGLLHHGSGPLYTDLLDPDFSKKFADYAFRFAERFPWVRAYTPINEPLTTARFSGLYGFWYPHAKDDLNFLRILFNQLQASLDAMRAIRSVQPMSQWIQTEDLGKVTSTEVLDYQSQFENHRRWLTFDALCGRIDEAHPLWTYLLERGVSAKALEAFSGNTFSPDLLGINHYLLSNRFLDHRLEFYPNHLHGSNGIHRYADVGACDTACASLPTSDEILQETWERYRLPLAVTEVHLNGYRESQMRWFLEMWQAAQRLREKGGDVRAITAWSLLGSFDWSSLCTIRNDHYEPGAFDVRGLKPRPTALSRMIQSLSQQEAYDHPVLDQGGWWHEPSRRLYGHSSPSKKIRLLSSSFHKLTRRPLLITGASGTLGRAFARLCDERGLVYVVTARQQMDIACKTSVRKRLHEIKPWAVINAAGYVCVDQAELEPDRCQRENVTGAENLAQACAELNLPFVSFSSDLVFDGSLQTPYLESHPVSPLNVYGRSKADAEKRVLQAHPEALMIRSSSFFSPWDAHNFIALTLGDLEQGREVHICDGISISPTYVPDLVHAVLDLLIDQEKGIWHLTNAGEITWLKWAYLAAGRARLKTDRIVILPSAEWKAQAPRPVYSVLGSERAQLLPSFENAFERFFAELEKDSFLNLKTKIGFTCRNTSAL